MEITSSVTRAQYFITEGRIVAFPTGTSYGLAVDALQGHALQRLRNSKGRPAEKTFTICMAAQLWPDHLQLTTIEEAFLGAVSGTALTLLVTPAPTLAHLAQDGKIGLRIIDHPLMAELTHEVQVPLTATSANKSGQPPCYSPEEIIKSFPEKLDETTYDLSLAMILDAGTLPPQPASTVAQIIDSEIKIIRPGTMSASSLEDILKGLGN